MKDLVKSTKCCIICDCLTNENKFCPLRDLLGDNKKQELLHPAFYTLSCSLFELHKSIEAVTISEQETIKPDDNDTKEEPIQIPTPQPPISPVDPYTWPLKTTDPYPYNPIIYPQAWWYNNPSFSHSIYS
jgi:hypothetical protein